jgi:hypothetical protein
VSVSSFHEVCCVLESALSGPARQEIATDACSATDLRGALLRLRDGMRSNVWNRTSRSIDLERAIQKYDRKARTTGFHVLHDWDGIADKVNDDTIPVDVLHYLIDRRGAEPATPAVLAILLDYYFMHILALLSIRIWDDSDADANLDRVAVLLEHLQGPQGSGHRFADDAETLILIGTSHYELHERGYGVLLEKARTLNHAHQTRIAIGHAASIGCHLRFGFEATYGRDTSNMRDDNVADYPWLCYALSTLMREYARMRQADVTHADRQAVVEAMLNGLSADARAFVGAAPQSLSACEGERAEFRASFHMLREDLLAQFDRYRPSDHEYSPLCFFFNFSHNVVKGIAIDALLQGRPSAVTLNSLLTSLPRNMTADANVRRAAAETLMAYARANPHRIRGRLRPVIVYDVQSGREAFSIMMRKLKE